MDILGDFVVRCEGSDWESVGIGRVWGSVVWVVWTAKVRGGGGLRAVRQWGGVRGDHLAREGEYCDTASGVRGCGVAGREYWYGVGIRSGGVNIYTSAICGARDGGRGA